MEIERYGLGMTLRFDLERHSLLLAVELTDIWVKLETCGTIWTLNP